jgi:NACHT domain- and WD repeat-containing protein
MAAEPSLSFRARQLVAALERGLDGAAPAAAWLLALARADRTVVDRACGPAGADAVLSAAQAGSAERPPLTSADVITLAARHTSAEGRDLVAAADVAAALVQAAGLSGPAPEPAGTAPEPAGTAPDPAGTAPDPAGTAPEPAGTAPEPAGTAPEPTGTAAEPTAPASQPAPLAPEPAASKPQSAGFTPRAAGPVAVPQAAEAGPARTFRLFVSSTFADFAAERDALRRWVWPRLRAYCASRGARFQEVDLRWGISEEAAVDQQTMSICLDELRRCHEVTPRPNFLVLIGNRYGWLPPPPRIPAGEWEMITPRLDHEGRMLLGQWYERDDNAVPAWYRLRPRSGEFTDAGTWAGEEARLHGLLAGAAAALPVAEDRRRAYLASATEQEIMAGAIEAERPDQVVCFIRDITGYPGAAASGPDDPVRRYADPEQRPVLAVRERLRERLGPQRILQESVTWGATGPAVGEAYLKRFTEGVYQALQTAIAEELEHPLAGPGAAGAADSCLDGEGYAHREFAAGRAQFFTGRAGELSRISSYLGSGSPRPLVLYGGGGSGKSALMAAALHDLTQDPARPVIVARFIGATPASSDGRALLEGICRELARHAGQPESDVPADYTDLVRDFQARLAQATARQPVIVFIDSLDQLASAGPAPSLDWIPLQLPPHVRLVASTRPGGTLSPLRDRADLLEVAGLPFSDGAELLGRWLTHAGRTLQPAQRTHILDGFERTAGNPLYLKLAFEEARRWPSAEGTPPVIVAAGLTGLIRDNLFRRLEHQHGEVLVSRALGYLAASRYGLAEDELIDLLSRDIDVYTCFLSQTFHIPPDLQDLATSYRSRHQVSHVPEDGKPQPDAGRAATEWIGLLRRDPARRGELDGFLAEVLAGPGGARLPVVLWSRLFYDLQSYLAQRRAEGGDLLAFHHRELGDAARDVYASGEAGRTLHSRLADYFAARADPGGDRSWGAAAPADLRGLSELPHHLARAGRRDDVAAVLTDFGFLEQKAAKVGVITHGQDEARETRYTGVYRLQDDFDGALWQLPGTGGQTDSRRRVIVTAADFGDGTVLRCPHCNAVHHYREEWRDQAIPCPSCHGPLKVNPFAAGRPAG